MFRTTVTQKQETNCWADTNATSTEVLLLKDFYMKLVIAEFQGNIKWTSLLIFFKLRFFKYCFILIENSKKAQ